MKNVNNITDEEIIDFSFGKKNFLDTPVRQQQIAQYIVGNVNQIADGMQISEDDALKIYVNHVKERFRKYKENQEKELKKNIENMVFAESEVTPQLMTAFAEHGIRTVNVIPDDEYEEYMFREYLRSLEENN